MYPPESSEHQIWKLLTRFLILYPFAKCWVDGISDLIGFNYKLDSNFSCPCIFCHGTLISIPSSDPFFRSLPCSGFSKFSSLQHGLETKKFLSLKHHLHERKCFGLEDFKNRMKKCWFVSLTRLNFLAWQLPACGVHTELVA